MDRARYYASVGDDARALRHLSKFGDVKQAERSSMSSFQNALYEEEAVINANEAVVAKEHAACPVLSDELKTCKASLKITDDGYRDAKARADGRIEERLKLKNEIDKLQNDINNQKKANGILAARFDARAALAPDERGRIEIEGLNDEIKRLSGLVTSLQAEEGVMLRARQFEKARVDARKSPGAEKGGCSVM